MKHYNEEHLKKLAKDPKYISGIYNYCDRWCERCQFTSRCMNYTLSEEQFGDLEDRDISNEAFWERLSEVLQDTLSMVKEMAEEAGIDLDSEDIEADIEKEDLSEEQSVVHIISDMAKI